MSTNCLLEAVMVHRATLTYLIMQHTSTISMHIDKGGSAPLSIKQRWGHLWCSTPWKNLHWHAIEMSLHIMLMASSIYSLSHHSWERHCMAQLMKLQF